MDRPTTASSAEVLLERRRRHVGKNVSLMYKKPLHIVRGRGQYLCVRRACFRAARAAMLTLFAVLMLLRRWRR